MRNSTPVRTFGSVLAILLLVGIALLIRSRVQPGATGAAVTTAQVGGAPVAALAAATASPARSTGTPAATPAGAAAPLASDGDVVDLAPVLPAEPPEGPCMGYGVAVDRAPSTVENTTRVADAVVAGTILEVGPARWNTPDEKPSDRPEVGDVMRLIRVRVDDTVAYRPPTSVVVAWVKGGVIGCYRFEDSNYPLELAAGERFVLFLNRSKPANATVSGNGVVEMWRIDKDGAVDTPDRGPIPLADLTARAQKAVHP